MGLVIFVKRILDSCKDLKIAVGADLEEEKPHVLRLEWGVNSIIVDSPMNPTR